MLQVFENTSRMKVSGHNFHLGVPLEIISVKVSSKNGIILFLDFR